MDDSLKTKFDKLIQEGTWDYLKNSMLNRSEQHDPGVVNERNPNRKYAVIKQLKDKLNQGD